MTFFNPNNPLALPKGSVRAMLVILFGVAVVFPIFKFAVYQQEIPQTVKEIMLVLVGGLQPIIKSYFDVREKEDTRAEVKLADDNTKKLEQEVRDGSSG